MKTTTKSTKFGVHVTTHAGSVGGTPWSVTVTGWADGQWQAEGAITLNGEAVHMCAVRGRRSMAAPAVPHECGAVEFTGAALSEDTIGSYAAMVSQIARVIAKATADTWGGR